MKTVSLYVSWKYKTKINTEEHSPLFVSFSPQLVSRLFSFSCVRFYAAFLFLHKNDITQHLCDWGVSDCLFTWYALDFPHFLAVIWFQLNMVHWGKLSPKSSREGGERERETDRGKSSGGFLNSLRHSTLFSMEDQACQHKARGVLQHYRREGRCEWEWEVSPPSPTHDYILPTCWKWKRRLRENINVSALWPRRNSLWWQK